MEEKTSEIYESKTVPGVGVEHNQLEVRCTRNVSGDQFDKGVQDYSFAIGGSFAWVPNRSYFRVGLTLVGDDVTNIPSLDQNVALADNVCANMYNNCYFRAGQQDVSSIVSYLPQASQVKNRLTKSGAWTRSIGKDAYGQDPSFASRVNTASSDGVLPGSTRIMSGLNTAGDATIAIATNGACTLANYTLASEYKIEAGDKLIVSTAVGEGTATFHVDTAPTADAGTSMVVTPLPAVAVTATASVLLIKTQKTPQRKTVYVHWCPPIGIFDSGRPMGSGDYRVSLNPESNYKKAAVQALTALTPGTDYDLTVEDISFFVSLVRVNVPPTMTEKLELTEVMIQTKAATDAQNNQLDFTLPPSTYGIAVYVQGSTAGSATNLPPSLFKTVDDSSNQLENIQITYANVSKPSTNWSSKFSNTENYLTQRYLDTQSESGLIFNEGGGEDFLQWKERGVLVFYRYLRDRSDRSTHCTVNLKHTNLSLPSNVHVAALYRRVAQITTNSGRVVDVQSLSV